MNTGSFFLGSVIGASLYAIFPMSVVLMSDVIGAVLASIALAVVKVPKLERKQIQNENIVIQFKEGFQVFGTHIDLIGNNACGLIDKQSYGRKSWGKYAEGLLSIQLSYNERSASASRHLCI